MFIILISPLRDDYSLGKESTFSRILQNLTVSTFPWSSINPDQEKQRLHLRLWLFPSTKLRTPHGLTPNFYGTWPVGSLVSVRGVDSSWEVRHNLLNVLEDSEPKEYHFTPGIIDGTDRFFNFFLLREFL